MIEALRSLGYTIDTDEEACTATIHGGLKHLRANGQTIFLNESGVSLRLLTAFCSLIPENTVTLTGVQRLCERPIGDLTNALKSIGARINDNDGFSPVVIHSGKLENDSVSIDGSISSQFISALMTIAPMLPR